MTRLFGTDGIRGVALRPPLDRPTVTRLGAALAGHLREAGLPPAILVAGDTRASTPVLAAWLVSGFVRAGGAATWGGVLPTPAVSRLLRHREGLGAGVIVSASHNPAGDNGIKLVTASGTKWAVEQEDRLEQRLRSMAVNGGEGALPDEDPDLRAEYVRRVVGTLPARALDGLRLVIDAAHGAASEVAGEVFGRLGAKAELINAAPDGTNINDGCGAVHPQGLAAAVCAGGADAGVAFDGDADRAVLVTGGGRVLDGDDVLYVWGRALQHDGRLPNDGVVATVMSNLGLEVALAETGIRLVRCPVGDRDVWDAMVREGIALGGEQSGHVICAHHAVTGDGLLTAAHILAVARARGGDLEDVATMEHFPQVLVNVPVSVRRPVDDVPELRDGIRDVEASLDGRGRVFVRYSGTEPLLRIMVEAATREDAEAGSAHLVAVARRHLTPTHRR